jgi:hypothetical protein
MREWLIGHVRAIPNRGINFVQSMRQWRACTQEAQALVLQSVALPPH